MEGDPLYIIHISTHHSPHSVEATMARLAILEGWVQQQEVKQQLQLPASQQDQADGAVLLTVAGMRSPPSQQRGGGKLEPKCAGSDQAVVSSEGQYPRSSILELPVLTQPPANVPCLRLSDLLLKIIGLDGRVCALDKVQSHLQEINLTALQKVERLEAALVDHRSRY